MMVKKLKKLKKPDGLRPYIFHGLDIEWEEGEENARGECLFCGGEKFGVEVKSSRYSCFNCGASGNASTFMETLWATLDTETKSYSEITSDRQLRFDDTPMQWGVVWSSYSQSWLVPGYNLKGEVRQLYSYRKVGSKKRLLPTPTLGHRLFGYNLFKKESEVVYICEGPWDAMALWENLRSMKRSSEGILSNTANPEGSLLQNASVLAVPGCNVFLKDWASLFAKKIVVICFDNDHPKKNAKSGKMMVPASLGGLKRITKLLSGAKKPPTEIHYLEWGEDGEPNLDLPSGYDVRDMLAS